MADSAADRKAKYQRVAYYPGCALEGTGHAYNTSTKAVGKKLGLELDEVKNWNCCGAMEVKNIDPKVQTYLSSRVMAIAANQMQAATVMAASASTVIRFICEATSLWLQSAPPQRDPSGTLEL